MLKRISLILMVLVAIVFLSTGCGSKEKSTTPTVRPEPVSIDGIYKTHRTDGPNFNVDIEDGSVMVDIIVDDTTNGLYWIGSAPKSAVGTFTSIPQKGALDRSILGSSAPEKEFVVDGNKVSFEFKALGFTTQIEATR